MSRRSDELERLARRAVGGDLDAAIKVARLVADKSGTRVLVISEEFVNLLEETFGVTRDVLLAEAEDAGPHEDHLGRWDRGGRGYDALELTRICKEAMKDPGFDWKRWLEAHREDMAWEDDEDRYED